MDLKKHVIQIYAIYAASSVLQFFEETLLLGLFFLIVGYILANAKKEKTAAKDTPFASHLQWLNRTFWIGTAVIVPGAMVIGFLLIVLFTDFGSLWSAMNNPNADAMMQGLQSYLTINMTKATAITNLVLIPTVVWWLRRCWIGYIFAKRDMPVENVKSWF